MHAFLTIRARGAAASLASAALLLGGVGAATAQADSTAGVRSHVHGADAALHRVVAAAGAGALSGPLAALEAQLRAAGAGTAKVFHHAQHAHKAALSMHAATLLTSLAAQENRDTTGLTPLLGALTGKGQTDLATFLAAATAGREQALSLATGLIGQVPAPAAGPLAGVLGQLSNLGAGQAGALAAAISPGSIACPAIDAVSAVIGTVLSSIQADLARVLALVPALPAGVSTQFTGVLNGLPGQLTALLASVKSAFNCPAAPAAAGQAPAPASPASGIGSLFGSTIGSVGSLVSSITQLVQKLLSGFLPAIGAGQTPAPVTVGAAAGPASAAGSLGSLPSLATSFIPNFASFFGGGGSGAMGSSFFGGFFGH